MPIYEFYCSECHTIFNFLSPRIDTQKRPDCPRCGKPELERRASLFSISKGRTEEEGESGEDFPDIDESKMEQAMNMLSREAEGIDEDDPKQAAKLMRKLFDSTGLRMGGGMEEAMRRLEKGEDPEQVEADLGDVLEGEDLFEAPRKTLRRKLLPPEQDETLYDL